MKKEIIIGIFALVSLTMLAWGYKFLKGKDLTNKYTYLYSEYEHIDQITVSTPVFINGLKVGIVTDIKIKPEDNRTLVVEYQLESRYKVPRDAVAMISPNGVMGDRMVIIENMHPCTDCLNSLDYIKGANRGMLGTMLPEGEINRYLNTFKNGITDIADSLKMDPGMQNVNSRLNKDLQDIESTIRSLKSAAYSFNKIMTTSDDKIVNIMNNVDKLTTAVAQKEDAINVIIENFKEISKKFKDIDINKTMNGADQSIASLNETLSSTKKALDKFNITLTSLNKGEGTAGKLLTKEDLYDNMTNATKELELVLQDLRLNPKRYINVSVFGKKQKKYDLPADDPAQGEKIK